MTEAEIIYCDVCNCYCACHPCQHTKREPDLVDFLIEAGVPGYKAIQYVKHKHDPH